MISIETELWTDSIELYSYVCQGGIIFISDLILFVVLYQSQIVATIVSYLFSMPTELIVLLSTVVVWMPHSVPFPTTIAAHPVEATLSLSDFFPFWRFTGTLVIFSSFWASSIAQPSVKMILKSSFNPCYTCIEVQLSLGLRIISINYYRKVKQSTPNDDRIYLV